MAGTLKIGKHEIGDHAPCYVIAEIGHNHQGSLDKARELFREAKLAGAHAVKLQKRDNRGLYTNAAYNKPYDNENSFGATYGEHREFLEFGRKEYEALQPYARELGVDVNEVQGTGPEGRISQEDVKEHARRILSSIGSSSGAI